MLTIPADVLKLRGIKAGDPLGIDLTPEGFNVRKAGIPKTGSADPGPVVCEPLGIRFPTLYRGVVTTTLEDLQACGLENDPDATLGEWVIYGLKNEPDSVVGTVTWEPVSHIFPGDREESFAVRHHPNIESAMGYLNAVSDFTYAYENEDWGRVFKTEDGIFTFVTIPTSPSWPGPLVLYLAEIPSPNWESQMDCWAHAVGPDGEIVVLDANVIPSMEGES